MKENELRIGNLITVNNEIQEVCDLPLPENCTNENTKPIPLTEEWLEKLSGILKQHSVNNYYIFRNNICLRKNLFVQGWSVKLFGEKHITNVIYVHQLQNLYFALTNNELEIKK